MVSRFTKSRGPDWPHRTAVMPSVQAPAICNSVWTSHPTWRSMWQNCLMRKESLPGGRPPSRVPTARQGSSCSRRSGRGRHAKLSQQVSKEAFPPFLHRQPQVVEKLSLTHGAYQPTINAAQLSSLSFYSYKEPGKY